MTAIQDKFAFLLQNVINLGDTIGPEEAFADGGARQVYTFGRIYFHPRVGAFESHGLILEKYLELGEQDGTLGYPISDESDNPGIAGGRMNAFEKGALLFDPSIGVLVQIDDRFLTPIVVVKLFDTIPLALGQGQTVSLDDLAAFLGPLGVNPAVDAARALLPGLTFARLFESVSPDELQGLVDRAQT
jgi:LGFP repeat-containing protein